MDTLQRRKNRRRIRMDADGKRSLALSVALYVIALLLPAYNVGLFGGTEIVRGWGCLTYVAFAPVPWSANIILLATWLFMIFGRKWTLPPAVATLVLGASLIALDPDLSHYFAGSAFWFMSMAVPIAYGLRQMKRQPLQVVRSVDSDISVTSQTPILEREQVHVR